MNTALILGHLIVVAMLPPGLCDTDSDCERVAAEFGCSSWSPDDKDAEPVSIFICNREQFERKQKEMAK